MTKTERKARVFTPKGKPYKPRKSSVPAGFMVHRVAEINEKGRVWRF